MTIHEDLLQICKARNYLLRQQPYLGTTDLPILLQQIGGLLVTDNYFLDPSNTLKKNFQPRQCLYPYEWLLPGNLSIKEPTPLFNIMRRYGLELGDFRASDSRQGWKDWGFFRLTDGRSYFSIYCLLTLLEMKIIHKQLYKETRMHGNKRARQNDSADSSSW